MDEKINICDVPPTWILRWTLMWIMWILLFFGYSTMRLLGKIGVKAFKDAD